MKTLFKSAIIGIFMISVNGVVSIISAQTSDGSVQKEYVEVKDPKERLFLCIEMLSNGTIKRTMTLPELQKIFVKDIVVTKELEDGKKLYTVRFEEIHQTNQPEYTSGFRGWYLRLEIDKHGKLSNYYLSNLHK